MSTVLASSSTGAAAASPLLRAKKNESVVASRDVVLATVARKASSSSSSLSTSFVVVSPLSSTLKSGRNIGGVPRQRRRGRAVATAALTRKEGEDEKDNSRGGAGNDEISWMRKDAFTVQSRAMVPRRRRDQGKRHARRISSSATRETANASGLAVGGFAAVKPLLSRLLPMSAMFYCMAFANSILDALKDTLVVTAFGGAEQIPYLTVYAVLPMSLLFVSLFTKLSEKWGREKLFYAAIGTFISFFVLFTIVLYPMRSVLHPVDLSVQLLKWLPSGLRGGIAVFTNWTYSLFYVFSELWGDVVLSLLFWGLANETTSLHDAAIIYPLLGIGANVAQASSGIMMKWVTGSGNFITWDAKLRFLMTIVLTCGGFATLIHAYICDKQRRRLLKVEKKKKEEPEKNEEGKKVYDVYLDDADIDEANEEDESNMEVAEIVILPIEDLQKSKDEDSMDESEFVQRELSQRVGMTENPPPTKAQMAKRNRTKKKRGLFDALKFVANSPELSCLAVMAISQGISTILFQVAWKTQLRILHPNPTAYAQFMGNVQMYSGFVTGIFMISAPFLFRNIGWKGTLSITPKCVIILGWFFFGTSIYASRLGMLNQTSFWLPILVVGGAAIYIVERAAKFSLFKPAEEMVYIALDDEAKSKGKAAVDVLGSQFGKTGGSFMQQGLLFWFGSIIAALPVMVFLHSTIALVWLAAVFTLAARREQQLDAEVKASD
jgi:AAA family ATP:ADP antiporter